jgi:hypothetical protein
MKRPVFALRILFLALGMIFTAPRMFPLEPGIFNANLTPEERAKLDAGEILIRNIGKPKAISLEPINSDAVSAIESIKSLDPNYLVEVIQVRPYIEGEDLTGRLKSILLDIPSYKGIPYWSVTNQQWFELYSSATVERTQTQGSVTEVGATLVMDPFTPIDAAIRVSGTGDSLLYSMVNNNNLKAEGITAIKKGCMNSTILVFRRKDSLVLYGIGGVKAPVIFFLKQRIERSFMNRIKTFCMFVYEKL